MEESLTHSSQKTLSWRQMATDDKVDMMRLYFAWLLILSTLLGAATVREAFGERSFPKSKVESAQSVHQDVDHQASTAKHSKSDCHDCHLGHCLFILGGGSQITFELLPQRISFSKGSIFVSKPLASLFRPPIA